MSVRATEPRLRGLKTVRVKRTDLLEKVRDNLAEHERIYAEALDGYHAAVIRAIEREIEEVESLHAEALKVLREQMRDERANHKEALEKLKKRLKAAQDGKSYVTTRPLTQPTNHVPEYEVVIGMLAASLDDELELDMSEYARFGLDRWAWAGEFLSSVAAYSDEAASKLARMGLSTTIEP